MKRENFDWIKTISGVRYANGVAPAYSFPRASHGLTSGKLGVTPFVLNSTLQRLINDMSYGKKQLQQRPTAH
ncbi:hypothetical protein [Pedobacter hiemivivus]|uniref:Uncharacterized protein n=1 Tax=Pedobacter hiemivivus TaxID=2530454 RepID=A0A4V2MJP0_9SPHI|nr:hypothetical protein [Pedobacter hiemivivus]TCC95026.1 hypothetical protein EZ444_16095 [Pedobacter hiemivivus]